MAAKSDDADFEAWYDSGLMRTRMRALYDAEKLARTLNDPTARDAARTALGKVTGEFLDATGIAQQFQDQMVDHALGEPGADSSLTGKSFAELTRSEMLRTRGGEAFVRDMAERGVMTLFALFGAEFAKAIVHDLRNVESGREGLFTFLPKAGVSRRDGPTHALQEKVVLLLGYTAGSTGVQLKEDLLKRAADTYNGYADLYDIKRVKPQAVREWTQRGHANAYRRAFQEGVVDRQLGRIDRGRQL